MVICLGQFCPWGKGALRLTLCEAPVAPCFTAAPVAELMQHSSQGSLGCIVYSTGYGLKSDSKITSRPPHASLSRVAFYTCGLRWDPAGSCVGVQALSSHHRLRHNNKPLYEDWVNGCFFFTSVSPSSNSILLNHKANRKLFLSSEYVFDFKTWKGGFIIGFHQNMEI